MSDILKSLPVMGKLKFLAKDAVYYGGLAALGRFSSILTFPFLTRMLSKEAFGVLDIFLVIEMLFVFISIMGQDSALARYFYDDEDKLARRSICSASLLIQLTLGLVSVASLLFFRESIMAFYALPEAYEPLIWILALKVFLTIPLNYSINLMKWSFARRGFALLTLGSSTLVILAALIGAYFYSDPIKWILLFQSGVLLVFGAIGLYLCRDWFGNIIQKDIMPTLFLFGLPYGAIALIANLVPSVDRAMISQALGVEMLAVYAVANRVANLFRIGTTAFQTAWGPFYMASYETPNAPQSFDLIFRIYTLFAIAFFLIFSATAFWFVPFIAGSQYASASVLSIYLALGILVQGIGWITGVGSFIAKKPLFDLLSYLAQLLSTFAGIVILLPIFGLLGVAISVTIGYTIQALTMTALGYYSYSLRFKLLKPVLSLVFATVIVSCVAWFDRSILDHISINLVAVIFIMIILYGFNTSSADRTFIMSKIKNVMHRGDA